MLQNLTNNENCIHINLYQNDIETSLSRACRRGRLAEDLLVPPAAAASLAAPQSRERGRREVIHLLGAKMAGSPRIFAQTFV